MASKRSSSGPSPRAQIRCEPNPSLRRALHLCYMLQWWNCKDLGQPENGGQDDHHKVYNILMSIFWLFCINTFSKLLFYCYVNQKDWKCDCFRSVLTYSRIGGHVKTLTFCQGSHYLAVASDNGSIQLLAVEANKPPKSPKVQPCQTRCVNTYSTCSFLTLCELIKSRAPHSGQCHSSSQISESLSLFQVLGSKGWRLCGGRTSL